MPESKLDPVITVDVNAAVKDSKVTAKVQSPKAGASAVATQPEETPATGDPASQQAKTEPVTPAPVMPEASAPASDAPKAKPRKPKAKAKAKPKPSKTKKPKAKPKPSPKVKRPTTAPKATSQPKSDSYMTFGDYSIHVRPNSGYSHLYRVLAQEVNFDQVCKALDGFSGQDEKSCTALLRSIFVERTQFEKKFRSDPAFVKYCEDKTKRIKEQASRGIAEAKAVLKNEKRFKDGIWVGNIREMISVCCGSTSPEANNRNMKKYANAKICFRQFPRVSRGNSRVFLTMFPTKHVAKVNRAIKTVFGDEKRAGFGDYLETKIKQVFG